MLLKKIIKKKMIKFNQHAGKSKMLSLLWTYN